MAGGSPGLPTAKLTHRASVTIILYPFTLFHNVNNLLGNAWHLLIEDDSISSSKLCTYWVYPYLNFSYVCDLLIYTACVWMPTCTHTPHTLSLTAFFYKDHLLWQQLKLIFCWELLLADPACLGWCLLWMFPKPCCLRCLDSIMLICALLVAVKLLHGCIYCCSNILWSPRKQGLWFLSFFSPELDLLYIYEHKIKESHYVKQLVWTMTPWPGMGFSLSLLSCSVELVRDVGNTARFLFSLLLCHSLPPVPSCLKLPSLM